MAKKELVQHSERYSKEVDNWVISASPKIEPLRLPIGVEVGDLKPLIQADGIIVKLVVADPTEIDYLISPQTLQDIKDSNNPHYTSGDSGKVKGAQMGKSIPIVSLDARGLSELAAQQDLENDKAGVRDATYIFEGDVSAGVVPNLLLEQINYTLLQSGKRPVDNFDLWNIQLAGDYSIEKLVVETAQSGSKVDLDKLAKLMSGVNERVQILRDDFNIIKDVYYNGKIPPNSGWTNVSKLAEDDTKPNPEAKGDDEQVVFKFGGVSQVQATGITNPSATPVSITPPSNPPENNVPTGSNGSFFSNIRTRALELLAAQQASGGGTVSSGGGIRSNVR
jgi:hypothetical protein